MIRPRGSVLALLALFLFIGGTFTLGYKGFDAPGPLPEETTIVLNRGTGFLDISKQLADQGVVKHPWLFAGYAYLTEQAGKAKAGEYAFAPGVTPKEVLNKLTKGDVVVHKITVAEGLTVRDVVRMLMKEKDLTGEIEKDIPEGSLLPDTYYFLKGDERMPIIRRMQEAMSRAVDDLWAARQQDIPFANPQEAVIMASIVEKETGIAAERGLVASVFINRLRQGMKLQADPTMIYWMERERPLGRPLTGADLRIASPYNSYLNEGLPPTPIANPGLAALKAVLNPPDTHYLFFVATGKGGHRFARTLKEHNANVSAYRSALDEARMAAAEAAEAPDEPEAEGE